LQDWEIHVRWLPVDSDIKPSEARASMHHDVYGGIVTIELTREWESFTEASDSELDYMAFHEMCHLLLAKLIRVVESYPMMTGGIREMEEHAVIRKLESYVFGSDNT